MIHVPLISVNRKKGKLIRLDSTYVNYNTKATWMPICYTNFFFLYIRLPFFFKNMMCTYNILFLDTYYI